MRRRKFSRIGRTLGLVSLAACLGALAPVHGQAVNREAVEALLAEGEIHKTEKLLAGYLKAEDLGYQDSVYVLKNLGVLYSSIPEGKEEGDKLFYKLLEMDPFASLHDTYAGNSIQARFKKIRKNYQAQKGGKALVPAVVIFDFTGTGLESGDGGTMAMQLIAEMQRLETFHPMERGTVLEALGKMKLTPERCLDQKCRLDLAARLTADKMVSGEVNRIDSVYTFTLNYSDVETGQVTTVLSKVFTLKMDKILSEGFGQIADELQSKEAAWLNLTVMPVNTILTIDGSPMAVVASRVPLNPGKHRICGSSPGYETVCKTFEVKRSDAVTYALVLPARGGEAAAQKLKKKAEDMDEEDVDPSVEANSKSHALVWWTLGAMAVVAVGLAVIFNTQD